MTERVSTGPSDGEAGGSNAVKVRPGQPKADTAKSTAAKSTAAAKSAAGPRSAAPKAGPKGAEPQLLTKAEKRALAKQRKARAIAARKRRKALTGALVGLLVVVVIAGGVWLISRSGGGTASTDASASASTSASAPAAQATTPAPFPPTPAGADPALGTKPTVTAGTGDLTALKVTTLIKGTGAEIKSGQSLTVNYVGVTWKDGKEFDSSWKSSQAFTTVIGNGSVIKGWDQGLLGHGVTVGSRVQLDIPSNLAYGDTGNPPGALRFVVDVLSAS